MRPYLETLFRRPLLLVAPLLLLPALVFIATLAMPKAYRVSSTLWVENPAVTNRDPQNPLLLTVSAQEAEAFRERLSTVAFRTQLLTDAGLADSVNALKWPAPQPPASWLARLPIAGIIGSRLKGNYPPNKDEAWKRALAYVLKTVSVRDSGDNLISVNYMGPDGATGSKLVAAATKDYLAEKAAAKQRKADDTSNLNAPIIGAAQADADTRKQALTDYQTTLPTGDITGAQQRQLQSLQSAYNDAANNLQQLKLSQGQSALGQLNDYVNQSRNLILVDAPGKTPAPAYGLKHTLVLLFLGTFLGLGLGVVLVVFRTWLDRTLRAAGEVPLRLQIPVLGSLPIIHQPKAGSGTW